MDTTFTVGEYAVSECKVEVKTGETEYSSVADLEEINAAVDNNTETWYSIADGGWQNALLTAKALSGSFTGKRCVGDKGNDFLDGIRWNIGRKANVDWKITFPDGSTLEFTAVTALTDILGAATNVAPLSGDITGKGKPKFTPKEA